MVEGDVRELTIRTINFYNNMNTKDIELLSHIIEFMSSKDIIEELFTTKGLRFSKNTSYRNLALEIEKNPNIITIEEVTKAYRNSWNSSDIQMHIHNLLSGLIKGHDWHGAMPSMLHLSIQNKVRDCCAGTLSLEEYLNIGLDIIKHEYFMVAVHDICESSIILSDESVIPPVGNKSVTDFIYNKIPYDLKISTHTDKWRAKAGQLTTDEKKALATELYMGADSERLRKQANQCKNNWGLNRMYYLVSNQEQWIQNPQGTINFLLSQLNNHDNFFDIVVNGYTIHICLIEQ